jgi:hypothetical protein
MYNSWERNTYLLKPEKIFHTFVSDPGDLLVQQSMHMQRTGPRKMQVSTEYFAIFKYNLARI